MSDFITHDHSDDGVDRRGFLKCMAWAGTGMLWTIKGGVPMSAALGVVTAMTALLAGVGTILAARRRTDHEA